MVALYIQLSAPPSVLSGGQLQRVLIARALYPDPKLLILDEGTANLDAENEEKILDTLKSLDITRIAVAHRPATLEAAERTITVDRGHAADPEAMRHAQAMQATIMTTHQAQPGSHSQNGTSAAPSIEQSESSETHGEENTPGANS